ncbi:hypothetical protein [Pleionea sediminis]|uniref:hypothetical protein n=1 Tax=Pleionea sediminis TaxID=2569479 RepID=UPI001186A37C|nr:hypothetical protein [Pleionea sediminis]
MRSVSRINRHIILTDGDILGFLASFFFKTQIWALYMASNPYQPGQPDGHVQAKPSSSKKVFKGCSSFSDVSSGTVERCNYLVSAIYVKGSGTIFFGLEFESSQIKVLQLKVNSDAFLY